MTCILSVPVSGDITPESLRAYTEAAAKIPAEHWGLVASIEIGDPDSTEKVARSGHLRLPPEGHQGQMAHGVGHLMGWQDGDRLLNAFAAWFWPGGKPKRGAPASDYGARHGAPEDLPETYRRLWRGDSGTVRLEWLRDKLRGADGRMLYPMVRRR